MNKKTVFVVVGVVAVAVVAIIGLSWRASLVSDQQVATPSPSVSSSCVRSCQDVPQAAQSGPASLGADAESEKAGVAAAVQVMADYSKVGRPQSEWFKALAPQLTTAYAEDAQYIQPSRLPVRKVTGSPVVVPAAVRDGYQLRVRFSTNAGPWVVVMTRNGPAAPWLAANVVPEGDLR